MMRSRMKHYCEQNIFLHVMPFRALIDACWKEKYTAAGLPVT